ncbi:MAG TPA: adenylate/guanylate cyclase domain-containing protein [Acetobacteraceae bacterium]|nr:adenylate/guanylate cyclase domain-containing protein [Acetobacteraceae bacterium]
MAVFTKASASATLQGTEATPRNSVRGAISVRRLRLATGFALFTYVASHLLNHSLGNISLGAMEAGLVVQKWLWQGAIGTAILYPALAIHAALGLWVLYERRHFGWTLAEVVQVVLGLAIPILLANHLFGTRISLALYGTEKGYAQVLYQLWVRSAPLGIIQVALLIVAWIHGCIGLYFWLRLKPRLQRLMPVLLCIAVVLPILALLGFAQGGRMVATLAQERGWREVHLTPQQVGTADQNAMLIDARNDSVLAFAGLIGFVFLARGGRSWLERRSGTILVTYPGQRTARVPFGFSVLEASHSAGVPHTSVCGGRGRCSTCRVRVISCTRPLPQPSPAEQAVLDRADLRPPVRLACQLRPLGDIAVVPLVPSAAGHPRTVRASPGEERFIVVLVLDMRDSTRLAETRLPFDTVFIMNRFISEADAAVTEAGGTTAQFTGDGLLAIFGLSCAAADACRQAVAATVLIGRNVAALNRVLLSQLAEPLRFGVGVAAGETVVGEIHVTGARAFTTLGDAANVASRLEALCKVHRCEAILSDEVCRLSKLALSDLPQHTATLRGRDASLNVRVVERVDQLAPALTQKSVERSAG